MRKVFVNGRFLTDRITGSGRFAIELIKEFNKRCPIILLTPKHIIDTKETDGLQIIQFGLTKGMIWEQVELPMFLYKNQQGALLINPTAGAPILYKKKIVTILDLIWKTNPEWFSKKLTFYHRLITPHIISSSFAVVAISHYTKAKIMDIYKTEAGKIHVLHCAVSASLGEVKNVALKVKSTKYILAVSSIDPRKNFDRLYEAYVNLNLEDVDLVLVGQIHSSFPNTNLTDNLSKEGSKITYLGYVSDDDLVTLYQNAVLFIYPSLEEGFGIPPLEAMLNNCPVITSNVSSLPEVCADAAFYVNPYDVKDIEKGILTLLKSDIIRKDLVAKGAKRVREFSWEKSASELLTITDSFFKSIENSQES